MSSSHPPSLLTVVERTLREECRLAPSKLLLAVSGGGDSMAMLHAMSILAPRFGLTLLAHGVDHGLRAAAAQELEGARTLAGTLGIAFSSSKIDVPPGSNLQARARAGRYRALRSVAREFGADLIATAHHADDRAETVLMRLLRGAGPTGLAVLPPCSGDLLRPLVRVRKVEILNHLERHRIQYSEDPSNADTRYLRSRIRHGLMKILTTESPAIVTSLNALADRMLELTAGRASLSGTLSRAQLSELQRLVGLPKDGAEIALSGGWVLRFERRKIPLGSKGTS